MICVSDAVAHIASTSNAGDLGLVALADLADAASGIDYRVIGGHMVHLLSCVYPAEGITARVTSDADAGVDKAIAAGRGLHDALLARGYTAREGNRYVKPRPDHDGALAVDILVPQTGPDAVALLGGRGFDAVPGLSLALSVPGIEIDVEARLRHGDRLAFVVTVPDLEAALVLKALAWRSRFADKDAADIAVLLEMVQAHRDSCRSMWRLADPQWVARGQRRDAAHALHLFADGLGRGSIIVPSHQSARLIALIRAHVAPA